MNPYAFGEKSYSVLSVHHDVLIIIHPVLNGFPFHTGSPHNVFVFFLDNFFVVCSFWGIATS